jgi:hypothetical protein
MVKSGLIFGAISLLFTLGLAVFISPACAPCLGLVLGLAAGYMAGVFDKPADSGESIKKGGYAGAIAGALGLLGGFIASVINGLILTPTNLSSFMKIFGINNFLISKGQIWASEIGFAVCIGLFDVLWMALLGVAGGALWYQFVGKNQTSTILPPQQPVPPAY